MVPEENCAKSVRTAAFFAGVISPFHSSSPCGELERNRLLATSGEARGYNFCIAGRLANRGDSNAQVLTFALRDRYQHAAIGPINI